MKEFEIPQGLYERALGCEVLQYVNLLTSKELLPLVESEAMKMLSEIKAVLNDDTVEDPECFYRIEAIMSTFEARGIPLNRHDW